MNIEREYRKFKINKFKDTYGYKFKKKNYDLFKLLHNELLRLKIFKLDKPSRLLLGTDKNNIVIESSKTTCLVDQSIWDKIEKIKPKKTNDVLKECVLFMIRNKKIHINESSYKLKKFSTDKKAYSSYNFEEIIK